jgi:hypothetical protein
MNVTANHLPIEKVAIGHSALISMSTLSESERVHVLRTLARLAALPPAQWPTDTVHLRQRQESLYMLDATDQLRVFFRRGKDDTITILSLVMQETLDLNSSDTALKEARP